MLAHIRAPHTRPLHRRPLHTHVFAPREAGAVSPAGSAPTVLALHGLTGHGRRWAVLAEDLPDIRVGAPDLLGHGHSPWQPPWSIADHVDALSAVLTGFRATADRPVVVVGHSFGAALAVHLAHRHPDMVGGLLMLDPAQGLDPDVALTFAADSLDHWDYPDAGAARSAKRAEGWSDVPEHLLEREITEHLIDRPAGRVGWRVSAPAAATAWSEMARPAILPPPGIRTHLVVADRVDPPFVSRRYLDDIAARRADTVRVHRADCGHMVPFAAPQLTAELVRDLC